MSRATDYVICRLCGEPFGAITVTHLRKRHNRPGKHPVVAYKRKFKIGCASCPDVRKRLKLAREDYWDRLGRHWTSAKVIAEIRRRHRNGRSLQVTLVPEPLQRAGYWYFGTWANAVTRAGFDYDRITARRSWTREKVIAEIQMLAGKGVPLYSSYIERHYGGLFLAATRRFPHSWSKALRAAGFNPDEHKQPRSRWNEPKARAWVHDRMKKQRSVWARDVPRDLLNFVRNRLRKTWIEFVESFGIPYPGIKKRLDWSKEVVLKEIRRLEKEGRPLTYKEVERAFPKLVHQARKFFNSWDTARAAAGVDPQRLRPVQRPERS